MSVFSNIYYLYLSSINTDRLSGLTGVTILHLSYSRSLRKIDFIPGLKKLVIDELLELSDLSEYRNIPELHIRECPKLNLSGLGNHEKFTVLACDNTNAEIDLSVLQKAQYIGISTDYRCLKGLDNVPSLLFSNLKFLCMNYNYQDFNITFFPNVRSLHLTEAKISSKVLFPSSLKIGEFIGCTFDDLFVLSKVKELRFYQCQGREFRKIEC